MLLRSIIFVVLADEVAGAGIVISKGVIVGVVIVVAARDGCNH